MDNIKQKSINWFNVCSMMFYSINGVHSRPFTFQTFTRPLSQAHFYRFSVINELRTSLNISFDYKRCPSISTCIYGLYKIGSSIGKLARREVSRVKITRKPANDRTHFRETVGGVERIRSSIKGVHRPRRRGIARRISRKQSVMRREKKGFRPASTKKYIANR